MFPLFHCMVTISISLIVILFTFLYISFLKKDSRVVKLVNKFPGPPPTLLFGNALQIAVPSNEFLLVLEKWWNIYGGRFRIWIANQPYVLCGDAKTVEKILTSSVHIEKSKDYDYLHAWLGTGLLTSKGNKWSSRRKLLTPAFHFKILDDFLEVFNEQSTTLVQVLSENCCDGKIINIFSIITRCALDIICETAMGKKIHAQSQGDSEYVRAVYEIGEMVMKRFRTPWLQPNIIWKLSAYGQKEKTLLKILHGFTNKVIKEKKEARRQTQIIASQSKDGKDVKISSKDEDMFMTTSLYTRMKFYTEKRRLAFLDLLLEVAEDGKMLTDSDIREETDTFMFEGHDTTAANLSWALLLLASNPECQEKVRKELDGIFGEDKDREITMTDLAQMKYLELCIKESLRIYPSVPMFSRQIEKDVVLDDDAIIPSGTQATILTIFLHQDPNVFPNPKKFIPERFLSENKRNPYSYVPFSAGPRNCIGQKFAVMEEKVILSKIIMNFILEAGDDIKDIIIVPDLILRPKNGIKLKVKRRSDD